MDTLPVQSWTALTGPSRLVRRQVDRRQSRFTPQAGKAARALCVLREGKDTAGGVLLCVDGLSQSSSILQPQWSSVRPQSVLCWWSWIHQ